MTQVSLSIFLPFQILCTLCLGLILKCFINVCPCPMSKTNMFKEYWNFPNSMVFLYMYIDLEQPMSGLCRLSCTVWALPAYLFSLFVHGGGGSLVIQCDSKNVHTESLLFAKNWNTVEAGSFPSLKCSKNSIVQKLFYSLFLKTQPSWCLTGILTTLPH